MIRYIIFILLGYLFYRLVRALLLPGRERTRFAGRKDSTHQVVDEMVKDPVCGVYVPKGEAVTALSRGETLYFCSSRCREQYLEAEAKKKETS